MIPLFTLGIPSAPVMAVLMAAFVINGLQPRAAALPEQSAARLGVIASLYIGNVILLILNLP